MDIIKSPLIYMGCKYSLIEHIRSFVPDKTDTFYDVFAGSFTVGANINAKHYVCNDASEKIIEILKMIRNTDTDKLISMIDERISSFGLDRTKRDTYYAFRDEYNRNQNPLDLFILHCHSFMHGIGYNSVGKYNIACGDSYFNPNIRKKLSLFSERIKTLDIKFSTCNFSEILDSGDIKKNDAVYCDPPYLNTIAFYNHAVKWETSDEEQLYRCLDRLASDNRRFILSNVFTHKNKMNQYVVDFAKKYNTYHIYKSYNGIDSLVKSTVMNYSSDEVIVTNNVDDDKNVFRPLKIKILW